jgi:hypothetical protein
MATNFTAIPKQNSITTAQGYYIDGSYRVALDSDGNTLLKVV